MKKEINLFVPGRICLFGEHSDWAGKYRNSNEKIEKGYAIVTGIEEGIHAFAYPDDRLVVQLNHSDDSCSFSVDMNPEVLRKIAEEGDFWCYIAGTALVIKERYNVGGVKILIDDVSLPMKKGLSSSAAICILVTRAFNQIYNLHLNIREEMDLAYLGEIATPSRCGRLDQACAYGKTPVLMTFDGDQITVKKIEVGTDLFFVFADLMAGKNTIKILADLNRCYPFAQTDLEKNVQYALGELNRQTVFKALEFIQKGDSKSLGELMNESQKVFDQYLIPACPSELSAPILHKTIENQNVRHMILGAKGVGSGGDGTVQFLVENEKKQLELKNYLEKELKMTAHTLTLNKTKPITKAIIPAAGNGTRLYPITKVISKAFLPIMDKDEIIKPAIMVLLEELDAAGIERIAIVIDPNDQKDYDEFFKKRLNSDITQKISPSLLDYEAKIQRIGRKIEFIYQEEKLGLGHAVSLCEAFVGTDNVLLVLGDQLYKTENTRSCTSQLLDSFAQHKKTMLSVTKIPLEDVSQYGILSGHVDNHDDYFVVDRIFEKPDNSYAKENLSTRIDNEDVYFAVLGEYILTPSVFLQLKEHISKGLLEKGEYQLTSALEAVCENEGMIAYIADGEMMDIGNVSSYVNTFSQITKK